MGILYDSTRFCEKCGKKMNEEIFIDHYDRYTGEEVRKRKYCCPEIIDKVFGMPSAATGSFMGHDVFDAELLF